jgi:hypothetical protein
MAGYRQLRPSPLRSQRKRKRRPEDRCIEISAGEFCLRLRLAASAHCAKAEEGERGRIRNVVPILPVQVAEITGDGMSGRV